MVESSTDITNKRGNVLTLVIMPSAVQNETYIYYQPASTK